MKTRILAALVMLPAVICAIVYLPTPWLAALAALVFLLGMREWLRLIEVIDGVPCTILLLLNLVLMVLMVWASNGSLALLHLALLVGVLFWLLALLWFACPGFGAGSGSPVRMLKLVAATLAIVPAWAALVLLHAANNGPYWLLTALAIVWAADSGAYFVGRAFGKHKLAVRISPNKTVEGMFGGLLAALVVAVGMGAVAGIALADIGWLLLVAGLAALASVAGDLFESLLKRHAGVKDSGNLIPGHGGVLDRIDGLLPALPVFALGKEMFGF